MKRGKAYYLIKECFDEVKKQIPNIELDQYRDGGSLAITIPTDTYDNIVMLAPIRNVKFNDRNEHFIEYVVTLKEGCTKFEDFYNKENTLESVMLEDRPYMLPNHKFDQNKLKSEIIKILKNRLKIN